MRRSVTRFSIKVVVKMALHENGHASRAHGLQAIREVSNADGSENRRFRLPCVPPSRQRTLRVGVYQSNRA